MYIQQLGEIRVPAPRHNTVGICNQIAFLVFYYNGSRLVTLLKVIYVPIQVPNIFYLTVSSKFLNFSFQICLFFWPLKYLLASCLTLFRLSTLLRLGSCIHCILACFLRSKKPTHYLSNHGLCRFNSCRLWLSLAGV